MKAPLYTREGKKKGEIVLNPEIYANRVNHRLLELVQAAYAANLRRGTASTKTRKEVRGGGRKPWRQKGTGRARHSSIRSPIWKGGGVVFGPHPRSYVVNLPQSMKKEALISALSLRGEQKNLFLIESVKLETPKTREWADVVKALPIQGKRFLYVAKDIEPNLRRASQNMQRIAKVQKVSDLNAYHVLHHEKIVIEQDAISEIDNRLAKGK
ncbi:MAG: 50S ribosomal protein L4 [Candidatus Omnitrophica bacterium]|nr:50S ribosomal protein L4 [Candidatus Omnitrophota bacterium]